MSSKKLTTCKICNKQFTSIGRHTSQKHGVSIKDYYDTFFKKEGEGSCLVCSKSTKWYYGTNYQKFCSPKCSNNHEETNQFRSAQHKIAYQTNPELSITITNKRADFYKNNPEAWLARNELHKQTLIDNSDIIVKQQAKAKKTFDANPSIRIEATNKRSIARRNTFNKLKKSNSTTPYFLYIIKHIEKPIIKIGVTITLEKRLRDLANIFGTVEAHYIVKDKYNNLLPLESYLHTHFNDHCKVQPTGGGRTEWFDSSILDEAVDLASSY